jgi:glycosyltransferase involved in cell wall biosynthesis
MGASMNQDRPVRVAMTSEVYYPTMPGGLLQFSRYGPGLKERGVQFHMHTKMEPEHEEKELEINGVQITRHELPTGLSHHVERELLLEHAGADLEKRRDTEAVCIQPCGVSRSAVKAMKRLKKNGIPCLMSFTMFPDDPPSALLRRLRHRLGMMIYHSQFDRFIACSHQMKVAFHKVAGFPLNKIEVLRNGVNLDLYQPGHSKNNELTVFYSGSITRRKGTDLLLKAWPKVLAQHPSAKLLIAGSFGQRRSFRDPGMRADLEAFTGEFEKLLGALVDRDSVALLGDLDSIIDYYQKADVFVFPSLLEGLPNSVLEAMSCGLPCVVSPFRGIPDDGEEFGVHGKEFIRSTHKPDDIARDLNELLSDKKRRIEIGNNARQWMLAQQSMNSTLDHLSSIYHKVAK